MSRRAISRPLPALSDGRAGSARHVRAHFPSTADLPEKPVYEVVTRIYNFLGALIGVILLSPLLFGIAAAVKLTSTGPALYRGARVGQRERVFHIFKFRTMHIGAEQKIGKRLVQQGEDHFTPIGRFLRRYRLDELAQLLNVLNGDMNLVGPRPVRPVFLEDHKRNVPGYAKRFFVRPGITGKAQVRGGYYTSPRHKLFYEVLYIRNRNVLMDLNLILLTFLRVMNRIFTTGFLLAWLLLMALVLPKELQQELTVQVGPVSLNLMYFVPPLIAVWHVFAREVGDTRLYALRTPADRWLVGFLAVSLCIVPFSRVPVEALKGVGWYLTNGVVVFYIVLNSRLVTERRSMLINTLLICATLAGLLSLDELLERAARPQPTGHGGMAIVLAGLSIVTLPLALARWQQAQVTWRRVAYALAAGVLLGTTLLTLRKAGLFFLVVAAFLYLFRERRRWAMGLLLSYLCGVAVLSTTERAGYGLAPLAAELRGDVQRQAQVLDHVQPLRLAVGVGARALPAHALKDDAHRAARQGRAPKVPATHNTWLSLLAEHGLLGFGCFVGFLASCLALMVRATRRITDGGVRRDLWAATAGLIGFAGYMGTADLFFRLPTLLVFFCVMGLGVGTALMHQPGPRTYYRIVHYRHKL
jgi:lipopolysaccharide/colanic/teichoic acid biosynthesis glycosyltransferase